MYYKYYILLFIPFPIHLISGGFKPTRRNEGWKDTMLQLPRYYCGSEWNRECPYCGFPRMEI